MTPERIVSFCAPNSELVFMIGSRFAGQYRMYAAIRNAQTRRMLSGLRRCRCEPQRGQRALPDSGCASSLGTCRETSVHASHANSPAAAAVVGAMAVLTIAAARA